MKKQLKIGFKWFSKTLFMLSYLLVLPAYAEVILLAPEIQNETLAAHNHWRAIHHAPPLSWDSALQKYAEDYASLCVFKHSHAKTGENLAAGYASVTAGVDAWYAEEADYSYKNPGFSKATGHFTQLVWVGTQKVGCGIANCNGMNGTPGSFLVCEYSPAGNITNAGYFEKNVRKP